MKKENSSMTLEQITKIVKEGTEQGLVIPLSMYPSLADLVGKFNEIMSVQGIPLHITI